MARRRVTVEATPVALSLQIAHLQAMPIEALRARWRTALGKRPPPRLPRYLLIRILAYQLQAAALGDLSRETQRELERLASGTVIAKDGRSSATPTTLRLGTELVREHDGMIHRVLVVDGGFAWKGATYTSLSDVARAITGTRWNGPRFFGLREKAR